MTDDDLLQAVADLRTLRTESSNPETVELSRMSPDEVIAAMHQADEKVTEALASAAPALAAAARRVAAAIEHGGRLVLLGTGTGGRLAVQEVSELPTTFGISCESALALVAGRVQLGSSTIARSEDDEGAAPNALNALAVGADDVVLGLAASGRTPFVLSGVRAARKRGAWTAGMANNPDSPLLVAAECAILLDTGPEVLTGSTRLKAGTAQKVALNRITTAAFVLAGRLTANHMTHMRVTNHKLRARAVKIVGELAGLDDVEAARRLAECQWRIVDALDVPVRQ